jgi:hypothetical protein
MDPEASVSALVFHHPDARILGCRPPPSRGKDGGVLQARRAAGM